MSDVPLPIESLLALKAKGAALGSVGVAALHCRFTRRVVYMDFLDGEPQELRWTDPVTADEAEVLIARIAVAAKDAGLEDRAVHH